MGKTCLIYAIMPEGPETDLEAIKAALEKVQGFDVLQVEDFVFGMKKINATFLFDDKAENTGFEGLEDALQAIVGVSNVEQLACTLI